MQTEMLSWTIRPDTITGDHELLELMLLKRPKENTKCVNAAGEELTAAEHKLKRVELKLFRDAAAAAAHMK
nr:hypothetical protein [Tanacetum cinerariifolium]